MDAVAFAVEAFGWPALVVHGIIVAVASAVLIYGLVGRKLPTALALAIVGAMFAVFAASFGLSLAGF